MDRARVKGHRGPLALKSAKLHKKLQDAVCLSLLGALDPEPAAAFVAPPHIPETLEKWSFHLGDASRSRKRYEGVGDGDEIPSIDDREPETEREEEEVLGPHSVQLLYHDRDRRIGRFTCPPVH